MGRDGATAESELFMRWLGLRSEPEAWGSSPPFWDARAGCGASDKEAVLGMRESQGRMAADPTDDNTAPTIQQEITDTVQEGATLPSSGCVANDGCGNL